MAQVQKLPNAQAHTDFVFSVSWEGGHIWVLILLALAGVAASTVLLVYRRRRRK
jgi:cell division protein FtsW (lipid II flippase)